jgi:hypothetical protein
MQDVSVEFSSKIISKLINFDVDKKQLATKLKQS